MAEFEDSFFDDLIADIEKLRATNPSGNYDAGWNSAVKMCILRLYAFFGHGKVPDRIIKEFPAQLPKEYEKALLFDSIVKELLGLRVSSPTADAEHVWNSAILDCLTKLGELFNRGKEVSDSEKPPVEDGVNHPSYYCDGGIEVLDYIMAKNFDFLLGQVCKYISRSGKKDPAKEIEDLKKARFYLDWKINLLKGKP